MNCTVTNDGPTAVEVAASFNPEVVLLDIGMPGMNGYQVAKKMRQMPGLEQTLLGRALGLRPGRRPPLFS